MIDERTEQLINRKLDGELTGEESLELDKRLIRCPQARSLMEQYAAIDLQAGAAIRSVVAVAPRGAASRDIAGLGPSRLQWWYSLGLVTAVAAAVSLAASLSLRTGMMLEAGRSPTFRTVEGQIAAADVAGRDVAGLGAAWEIDGPRRETTNVERNVLGVWDRQSQSLYLIEADSTRSMVEPMKANY